MSNQWTIESHNSGWNYNSPDFMSMREQGAIAEEMLEKAFTTGSGAVASDATGGQALRTQFLPKVLQQVSFDQDDAGMMKHIKKKKVPNNTIEWADYISYGVAGDGFVGETGVGGTFGVAGSDDNFARQVQTVKYMGVQRTVSLVSSLIQNQVSQPMKVSEQGATMALISAMNLSLYWGNEKLSANQFNGFQAQILDWVNRYPSDAEIIFDCGGQPLNKDILETISEISRLKFGRGSMLMTSVQAYGDLQRSLYPSARYPEGSEGTFGVNKRKFKSTRGEIDLMDDVMLRTNQPLVADGDGINGKPRTASTASLTTSPFAATPYAAAPAAGAAGTGRFWQYRNVNTDSAELGTAPEVPSASYGGNNGNRLRAGTYYYAVAAVIGGQENIAWVYGAAAAGTTTAATGIAVTAGQVVRIRLDLTTPCLTGLGGASLPRNLVKFRVYRYGGPGITAAPTSLLDFDLLGEVGCPTGGNSTFYDNGYKIPGTDEGYFLTEKKNGSDGYFLAELLPLLKRPLPHLALADLFCLLAFVTPILWVPRHHIYLRNIGRAVN